MPAAAKAQSLATRSIERVVLGNGVKVWSEHMPGADSIAVGVWINNPSPFEEADASGATHLVQRASFHGTKNRTAESIAREVKALGGHVSIVTERDHAGYLAETSAAKLSRALALLAELALFPALAHSAISAEQRNVLSELLAAEDDTDLAVEEIFLDSAWLGRGHCRKPKGRLENVRGVVRLHSFRPTQLRRLHRESHNPAAITITLAGDVKHDDAQRSVMEAFGDLQTPPTVTTAITGTTRQFWAVRSRKHQGPVSLMVGVPVCGASDDDRHFAGLLSSLLEARSHTAKVESSSSLILFAHSGVMSLRVRVQPEKASEGLAGAVTELRRLTSDLPKPRELSGAQAAQTSAICPELPSPAERIGNMAKQERYRGGIMDVKAEVEGINAATPLQVQRYAAAWIGPRTVSSAAVGDLSGVDMETTLRRW